MAMQTIPERPLDPVTPLVFEAPIAQALAFGWELTSSEWDDPDKADGIITITVDWKVQTPDPWSPRMGATAVVGVRSTRPGAEGQLPRGALDLPAGRGRLTVTTTVAIRVGAILTDA
jgi:hypothetical protein